MFSYNRSSLHQALIENRTDDFIAELKTSPDKIHKQDINGCTLIQTASMMGNVSAVLHLLYEGAKVDLVTQSHWHQDVITLSEKPPFYLALEYNQYMVSHILFYLGANKQLSLRLAKKAEATHLVTDIREFSVDVDIFRGMLGWLAIQDNADKIMPLMKRALSVITSSEDKSIKQPLLMMDDEKPIDKIRDTVFHSDLCSLMELLAQKKHFTIAQLLQDTHPHIIRTDPRSAAFGYWAAIYENKPGYQMIKENDPHMVQLLLQLNESKESVFDKYYKKASPNQIKKYNTSQLEDDKLEPFVKKIYRSAKYASMDSLSSYINSSPEEIPSLIEAATFAMHAGNVVALNNIFSASRKLDLIPHLLSLRQKDLLLMYMFLSSEFSYEFIRKIPDHPEELFSILEIPYEKTGILYRFMQNGLNGVNDLREKEVIEIQKKYFRALYIDSNQWMQMYFKIAHRRDDVNSIDEAALFLEPDRQSLVKLLAMRFNYTIEFPVREEKNACRQTQLEKHQDKFFHNKDYLRIMRPYLSTEDEAKLNSVSRFLYANGSLLLVSKIKSLQAAMEEEIESKPFFENRNCTNISITALTCIILLLGTAIAGRYLASTNSSMREISNEMRSVNTTNGTCADLIATTMPCDWSNPQTYESPCQFYCDQLYNLIGPNVGALLGTVFGSIFTFFSLVFSPAVIIPSNLFSGKERFDNIHLNDLSDQLRYKATRLFAEFKEDPEFRLTMVSTISEVRNTLNNYVHRLNSQNQRQTLFQSEATRIDIEDALPDVALETKQDERTLYGSINF